MLTCPALVACDKRSSHFPPRPRIWSCFVSSMLFFTFHLCQPSLPDLAGIFLRAGSLHVLAQRWEDFISEGKASPEISIPKKKNQISCEGSFGPIDQPRISEIQFWKSLEQCFTALAVPVVDIIVISETLGVGSRY